MTMDQLEYRAVWLSSMQDVAAPHWNALMAAEDFPFLEWEWLYQLERCGCVSEAAGWIPCHLTLRRGERLVAAAPLYIKLHSRGEFVFDGIWSELADRLGVDYFPKMVGMVPFTPVAGYRFLIAPGEDQGLVLAEMTAAIEAFCLRNHLGGCHLLHVDAQWHENLREHGFTVWLHSGFVWTNPGYRSFDAYVAAFTTGQRRNIRREQLALTRSGIELQTLTGPEIDATLLSRMYRFYARTNEKFGPWGCKYLNEEFFLGLGERFRHRLLIVTARRAASAPPLGLSLLVTGGKGLYGRYWGEEGYHQSLHFNCCYYAPIAWAIAHGILSFDPGMGGEHKVRRGFFAVPTYSLHRHCDPRLQRIMDAVLPQINRAEQSQIEALNRSMPQRSDGMKNGLPRVRAAPA